jgi:UPF0755 protein
MKTGKKLLLTGTLLALAAGAFLVAWGGYLMQRPLQIDGEHLVHVPSGSSFSGVLYRLQGQGLLGEGAEADQRRLAARVYALVSPVEDRIHVGEYRLEEGDSLLTLLRRMEAGEVLQRDFTIVEGWNIRELRARLADAPGLESLTAGMTQAQLMTELERPERHPEGWFAPDTYFYVRGDTDLSLLHRAMLRQESILESAWADRDEDLPYDGPYEALVMASIVEKETAVPAERGEIAGVFVNRLRLNMRLQTDPTVIYGLGEAYDGNITRADLKRETPYNTYRIAGLPPTPIAMPGAEAIRASLSPQETEALYFVARGDGTHKFSRTLEEHEQAVRDYQLRRRSDYRSTPESSTTADAEKATEAQP